MKISTPPAAPKMSRTEFSRRSTLTINKVKVGCINQPYMLAAVGVIHLGGSFVFVRGARGSAGFQPALCGILPHSRSRSGVSEPRITRITPATAGRLLIGQD